MTTTTGRVKQYLRVPEAAKEFGIPESWLYRAIRLGELAYLVPAGQRRGWRLMRRDVERWLSGCRVTKPQVEGV